MVTLFVRIIAISTLRAYWILNPKSKAALAAWVMEVKSEKWENSHELKEKFRHASIITNKRVVFNIKGNTFRLIVDIEYRLKIIFIVWIGTHEEYDKIDAKTIEYE